MVFKDRVALVTGGSRGIGKSIAQQLVQGGAQVFIFARDLAKAQETASQLGNVTPMQADVADFDQVEAQIKQIIAQTGKLDYLINNAGITRDNLLMRMDKADWDAVINTNLGGAFNCTKAVTRQMSKQRFGRIVNITSIIGAMGNAGQANYSAAKAGLMGLTKSAARELASRNITVNAVAPGFIETDMTAVLPENIKSAMLQQIPLGRFGQPEDVAQLTCFLLSDTAGYITGQVFHVNGGLLM
ncbi:MAG: 3-oxoacyl-[acyl-carrier-protein] reductase [Candidatus Schekmanbacteria bacterium]|nr:3-oxoacyl-[acyl-carrier-protein] reductase [Candidatus Schekmanbacteria bacterium]